jgi:hypothetical protein
LAHVQEECLIFERWYRTRYEPPALKGLTPTEARADFVSCLLPADFNLHQAEERLPLTAGKVHFIRLVNSQGQIRILNEPWAVDKELVGEYVWATISTAEQRLRIHHQAAADAVQRLVAEYEYEIAEEVQDLALAYRTDGEADASA